LRIAVVCPYDLGRPGGVQQLTIELVDRLGRAGHESWLVGPGERAGTRSVGSTVTVRGNDSAVPVALGFGVAGRTRTAVAGADVVHVHEPLIPRVSTSLLRAHRPRVMTFHADPPAWARSAYGVLGRLSPRLLRGAVVSAVSPVAAAAVPPAWGPVEVVPNALDVDGYAPTVVRRDRQVAYLGRDDPRKGLDVLLQAWPMVRAEVADAELVVMGASRPVGPAGVVFAGRVDEAEKRRVLAASLVYVAPNTGGESFGIVIAEAMAAGAAVVASDLPAFRHVMGETGVTVPVNDAGALAASVVGLLTDPESARRLGERGRQRVRLFDWPNVIDRYEELYRRALG
jgi:phosphatidyl-myo-inositol alpha-mannosyltransferase